MLIMGKDLITCMNFRYPNILTLHHTNDSFQGIVTYILFILHCSVVSISDNRRPLPLLLRVRHDFLSFFLGEGEGVRDWNRKRERIELGMKRAWSEWRREHRK